MEKKYYQRAKISKCGKSKFVRASSIRALSKYCHDNGWTNWVIVESVENFEIVC